MYYRMFFQALHVYFVSGTFRKTFLRIARTWTNQVTRFGNINSSRAEGQHSIMKGYLKVSTKDLQDVIIRLSQAFENSIKSIQTKNSAERIKVNHSYKGSFYQNVVRRTSIYALYKVSRQLELAQKWISEGIVDTTCTRAMRRSMRLPCAHQIYEKTLHDRRLSLDDYHPLLHLVDVNQLGSTVTARTNEIKLDLASETSLYLH
ncbi:hypothetical protein PsorP6_000471 [Peronosclerospora sorghi]|uniref:Uncharacterized protein n=1 Tax=Peronosclerospora sorghi TaxID=230839 RepID=A0ACC0WTA1_9STRA|nr:hypothetical protein PsorP6_000471 [Peronosclerospora sorghi]